MTSFHLSVLSVFVMLYSVAKGKNTTLLLVQTLSRHGDRAPSILYPNDLNSENCWPNGVGQLTQLGWKQQLDTGKFLRSLYRGHVTQDPKQIYVNSSGENRCLDSAAAQLISFYAPNKDWNLTQPLDRQLIPIHYLPPKLDRYLNYKAVCPRARVIYLKTVNDIEDKESQEQKAKMEELSKLSGLSLSSPFYAYNLFVAVQSQMIHNCSVPKWAYRYLDDIKHAYDKVVQIYHSSPVLTRLYFGPFLGLLNNNLKNKINGKTDLKFVLNVSHDVQVAGVLGALNFTDIPHPPFGATLLFELHQMVDASMAVRLRYINTTYPLNDKEHQPVVLTLNGCTEFCPAEYFMKSYQWLIPDDWEEECLTDKQ